MGVGGGVGGNGSLKINGWMDRMGQAFPLVLAPTLSGFSSYDNISKTERPERFF